MLNGFGRVFRASHLQRSSLKTLVFKLESFWASRISLQYFLFLSVLHCRCSKCYSVPTKKRVRKRVPPALGLLSLPEEVLLCILQCLSAEDLLSVRAVSESTVTLLTSWRLSFFIYCGADKLWPVDLMVPGVDQLSSFLLQTHSQLRDIVDNHSSVWARVSFRDSWPSPSSLWLFERYRHGWQSVKPNSDVKCCPFVWVIYWRTVILQGRWKGQFWSCCEARNCLLIQRRP